MTGGIWALATGVLQREPERREGSRGPFATGSIRVGNGDGVQWVGAIAFGEAAERLLTLKAGDAVSVAGRLELRTWSARDGTQRTGISIVADEVAAARPRARARPQRASATRMPRHMAEAPELNDALPDLWSQGGRQ
jgi:single-stranded DNA-binding protein